MVVKNFQNKMEFISPHQTKPDWVSICREEPPIFSDLSVFCLYLLLITKSIIIDNTGTVILATTEIDMAIFNSIKTIHQ